MMYWVHLLLFFSLIISLTLADIDISIKKKHRSKQKGMYSNLQFELIIPLVKLLEMKEQRALRHHPVGLIATSFRGFKTWNIKEPSAWVTPLKRLM
jgi:hypothetical protein